MQESRHLDFLGGILVDDMGLGKKLTTLTTVVNSHGHAARFGAGGSYPNHGKGVNSPCLVSQATLVVVPSKSKFSG